LLVQRRLQKQCKEQRQQREENTSFREHELRKEIQKYKDEVNHHKRWLTDLDSKLNFNEVCRVESGYSLKDSIDKKIQFFLQSYQICQSTIQDLNKCLLKEEEKVERGEKTIEELTKRLLNIVNQAKGLTKESSKADSASRSLADLEQHLNNQCQSFQKLSGENGELINENRKLLNENETLTKEKEKLTEENVKLTGEKKELGESLKKSTTELTDSRELLNSCTNENRKDKDKVLRQIDDLKEQAQKEKKELLDKIEDLENRAQKEKKELLDKIDDLENRAPKEKKELLLPLRFEKYTVQMLIDGDKHILIEVRQ